MRATLAQLIPFKTPDTQRLALLFAVVYFAQGMYELPDQPLTLTLKERLGLSAGQAATFLLIVTVPWYIKPVYGLLSDFVPFLGRRRKSYFLVTTALAASSGFALALVGGTSYWRLAALYTAMGLGIAFTDVLTDALMVENGRPRGLTGAFQSVQWAAIYGATILAGILGGYLAEGRDLASAFAIGACFPLVSFTMALLFVREPPARDERGAFLETWAAIREALGTRHVWVVAGFILFWTFSPSFGPAFLYYQTDVLKFDQQFIGFLRSLGAASAIVGALLYAPLSRRVRLKRIIIASIGVAAASTLAYLLYRDRTAAILIDGVFGGVGMITQLAFLDLAAKACPRRVEGTFFALLMSVFNLGVKGSQITGGYLYDWLGYTPLVLISAAFTAAAWCLVPLVKIEQIEATALKEATAATTAPAAEPATAR